jgi:hypothetical protein
LYSLYINKISLNQDWEEKGGDKFLRGIRVHGKEDAKYLNWLSYS